MFPFITFLHASACLDPTCGPTCGGGGPHVITCGPHVVAVSHTWFRYVTRCVKKRNTLCFFRSSRGDNASEDLGSPFHLIMTEDFLRNVGTRTRPECSWTPRPLSVLSLALIHGSQVLFCPKFVKKFVVIMMPLHSTTTRHDFDQ